ncbi:NAD(P)/FAD-dependent oxidoreductase [Chelatococcus sp. SYSU_G07232]|uniref:NAD(P)/FAD-dependent oxidoreductase n=1 Tax=Chelatococcus albus TaxID=3047466 RepID=A0ABT7AJW0_9HYPH|nr:NAD(P)/FAD-dependent oxidoreductase [Chelatococcus sp. SYSU_G07232]MDJ1159643.1 NAD(P)/FAD-dependent oxidoreductase [Chelatococcus sp. SYSU_G07232]
MSDVDAVVVGAGVVGLAVARNLALAGHDVLVMEAAEAIGTETSSRNSEVIHAGIYYPPGSLKARLCVEGKRMLYAYCAERGVPHRRCGKLIVATEEGELATFEGIAARARANGVDDIVALPVAEVRAMEPALATVGALWSPSTGILDSHAYMLSLQGDAEAAGAAFAFRTPFLGAEPGPDGFNVRAGGTEPTTLTARLLVNAAGLHASRVARTIDGLEAPAIPDTRYCKGNYFVLGGRAPFSHLVYPAPQTHGLGVHLTLDLGGQARFGPDTEWVEELSYTVDPRRVEGFIDAIRRYWPGLPAAALTPGYCGIRPKIAGPQEAAPDFRIDGPERHGLPGLVNLFGIESPGLTASLAIASEVAARLAHAG